MAEPELVIHAGVGKAKCSCGAPIVFAIMVSGKKAPFHVDDNGEWILENGNAKHVGPRPAQLELGAAPVAGPQRYTSHFATCPDAAKWRGRK